MNHNVCGLLLTKHISLCFLRLFKFISFFVIKNCLFTLKTELNRVMRDRDRA